MQIKHLILELLKKHKYNYYIYEPVIFEKRINEEKIRADHFQSNFAYIEIFYRDLLPIDTSEMRVKAIWDIILEVFSLSLRGSDIKGHLKNDEGLGVMMVDCDSYAPERLRKRIVEKLYEADVLKYIINKDNFINAYFYTARSEDTDITQQSPMQRI
ncbi:MAG: hypothetical protein OCD01_10950 [Fibrobacterales bacterium]